MTELLIQIVQVVKSFPTWLRALMVIAILCAGLGYVYLTKEGAPAPTKQVGNIEQTGTQQTTNGNNTNSNSATF